MLRSCKMTDKFYILCINSPSIDKNAIMHGVKFEKKTERILLRKFYSCKIKVQGTDTSTTFEFFSDKYSSHFTISN